MTHSDKSTESPPQIAGELLRLARVAKDNGDIDLFEILWAQYWRKAAEEQRAA